MLAGQPVKKKIKLAILDEKILSLLENPRSTTLL
jgi:hypothetical protein